MVGWVAILKMAAMASYSAQGGFSVSISTTVQPRLLEKQTGKREKRDLTHTVMHSVQREPPCGQRQGKLCSANSCGTALCSTNPTCAPILSQSCQRLLPPGQRRSEETGRLVSSGVSLHQLLGSAICPVILCSHSAPCHHLHQQGTRGAQQGMSLKVPRELRCCCYCYTSKALAELQGRKHFNQRIRAG